VNRKIGFLIAAALAFSAEAKEYAVIDIIGDSISSGTNPEIGGNFGWVNMLFGESGFGIPAKTNTVFSLWPGIQVHNSAVSGSRASQWADDWNGNLSAVKSRQPDLVVVYIGGNDFLYYIEDGVMTSAELAEYEANLTAIVTDLQNNDPVPDIILATYYDMFDGHSHNLDGAMGKYINSSEIVPRGNTVIADVAASNNCYLIDGIYGAFFHRGYGAELGDQNSISPAFMDTPLTRFDVHPITPGHSAIHDLFFEKLAYLKQFAVPENWMHEYGFSADSNSAQFDSDNDGHANWEEYFAGTDPTNRHSVFSIQTTQLTPTGNIIQWNAAPNRKYDLFSSTNLTSDFTLIHTDITGGSITAAVPETAQPQFYRIEVRLP